MTFVLTYAAIAVITTLCLTLIITAIGSAAERVALARSGETTDEDDDSTVGGWHPSSN